MGAKSVSSSASIAEMGEFARFVASTQRYIRRSMDVAEDRHDVLDIWSRDAGETALIRAQRGVYSRLPEIRARVPECSSIMSAEPLMSPLVTVAAFDLSQGRLPSFSAFRFLYERILGGGIRPWLPSAFLAAAAYPTIHPDRRKTLLQSVSEATATAPGWSSRDPVFFPSWVDKVEMA